jgi:radical SAM PhpK family P-methyltransferase
MGHNDVDFAAFSEKQRQFADRSAGHSEIVTNSVCIQGKRRTYMELLNTVMERVDGRSSDFNTFRVPSLAVAYLVNFLRQRKLNAEGVNFFNTGHRELAGLLACSPTCVAITTTYYVDDEPIREIVAFIRCFNRETRIVVGGPRILSLSRTQSERVQMLTFRSIGADIYVESAQGESTLARVVRTLAEDGDLSAVPNLTFRGADGGFVRTSREVEENGLEDNTIDWASFPSTAFTPINYMRTARSCPFSCEFCNYPAMAGSHTYVSVEVIEQELRVMKQAGVRDVIFIDDTFNVPFPRFKDICRMMIRNCFGFRWVSFFRCSSCDEEALDLMQESGCLGVYLGIESGDPGILRNMHKFARIDRYCESIGKLTERGILSLASMIVGFPGETAESVQNSIDFLNEAKATFYNVQVYYHDTLAPIEKRRSEFGITGSGYSWRHTTMDWREAVALKEKIIREVVHSLQLPLYGFSIWTVPYLLRNGLSLKQILEFTRFANTISHAEIRGEIFDVDGGISALIRQSGWRRPSGADLHAIPLA